MKRIVLLLLAVMLSHGLCAGPQQITWTTPSQISTVGVNASQVKVVSDSNGNVTAAWLENGSVIANSLPSGGSWGTATTLTSVSASSLHLGVDSSGNVTAIWIEGGVVYTAALPFGGSWSAKASISGSGASQARLSVASGGNVGAVWTRNSLIGAATKPSGGSWSLESQLSTNGSENDPDIYLGSNGTTVAVWHTAASGADALQSARSTTLGTWATAINMLAVSPGNHHDYPRVAVDNSGNAYAVWFAYKLSGSAYSNVSVLTATLSSSSSSWTAIPTILTQFGGLLNPANLQNAIKVDGNGNVMAFWTNSYDGAHYAVESGVLPVGGSWQSVGQIVEQNQYAFQGDITVNSAGHGLIGYMWYDGTNIAVQVVETDLTSPFPNSFTIPVTVSTSADNGYPSVAFSTTSTTLNAVALWEGFDGTHTTTLVSTGTASIVQPATALSVVQSSNNNGIFTEYYNTFSWTDSVTPSVVNYAIYRNGFLISEVASPGTQFIDHNAVQNGSVTYGIIAIDSNNDQSPMATKSFP
jgi:hypothetical protein